MVYKKRYYNRRRKNTRKFNRYAYAKTDAKSQSKQIVRLNKKISRVYNNLKPDLKYTRDTIHTNFSSSSGQATFYSYKIAPTVEEIKQKYIFLNLKIGFNITESSKSQGFMFRLAVIQRKQAITAETPTIEELFENSDVTYRLISPYKRGINTNYKILYDRVISVPENRDTIIRKVNLKNLMSRVKYGENYKGDIYYYLISPKAVDFSITTIYTLGYVSDGV